VPHRALLAAVYQGLALMLADGAANERSELHESCVHMADLTEKLTARPGTPASSAAA
jgi:hypothetical protein